MSVTEYKRRRRRNYILIGALAAALPACVLCVTMKMQCNKYRKQNEVLVKEKQEAMYITAVVLKKPVAAGERIEDDMLAEVTVCAGNMEGARNVSKKKLVGTFAKSSFQKGTFMNPECVYEEKQYSSDMRRKDFDFITGNSSLQSGDYVDVRVTYPNGEDYIVVSCKQVEIKGTEQELQNGEISNMQIGMEVTEEEILRLASAYVDTVQYPGTVVYTVAYLDQFQPAGTVDYPVNMDVFELLGWNPNAVGYVVSQREQECREILEENLSIFQTTPVQKEIMQNTDSF